MNTISHTKKVADSETTLKTVNRIYSILILAILLTAIIFLVYITKQASIQAQNMQDSISFPILKNITTYVTKFQF